MLSTPTPCLATTFSRGALLKRSAVIGSSPTISASVSAIRVRSSSAGSGPVSLGRTAVPARLRMCQGSSEKRANVGVVISVRGTVPPSRAACGRRRAAGERLRRGGSYPLASRGLLQVALRRLLQVHQVGGDGGEGEALAEPARGRGAVGVVDAGGDPRRGGGLAHPDQCRVED